MTPLICDVDWWWCHNVSSVHNRDTTRESVKKWSKPWEEAAMRPAPPFSWSLHHFLKVMLKWAPDAGIHNDPSAAVPPGLQSHHTAGPLDHAAPSKSKKKRLTTRQAVKTSSSECEHVKAQAEAHIAALCAPGKLISFFPWPFCF